MLTDCEHKTSVFILHITRFRLLGWTMSLFLHLCQMSVCSYSQFVKLVRRRIDAGGLRTFWCLTILFLPAQPYLSHFCVEPRAAGVKATRVSAHLLQTAPRWPALWPWPSRPCLSGSWPWAGRTHGWLVRALFLQFLLYRQMIARETAHYTRIYTFLEFLGQLQIGKLIT